MYFQFQPGTSVLNYSALKTEMPFLPLPCNEVNKDVQQPFQVECVMNTASELCHRNHDLKALSIGVILNTPYVSNQSYSILFYFVGFVVVLYYNCCKVG